MTLCRQDRIDVNQNPVKACQDQLHHTGHAHQNGHAHQTAQNGSMGGVKDANEEDLPPGVSLPFPHISSVTFHTPSHLVTQTVPDYSRNQGRSNVEILEAFMGLHLSWNRVRTSLETRKNYEI